MWPYLQEHIIETPDEHSGSLRPQKLQNTIPVIVVERTLSVFIFRLVAVSGNHVIKRGHQEAKNHSASCTGGDAGEDLGFLECFELAQPFFGNAEGGELRRCDEGVGHGGFYALEEAFNLKIEF